MNDRMKEKAVLCYYDELLPVIEDSGMSDAAIVRVMKAWWRWARDGEMPVLEHSDERVLFTMLMKQTGRDRERREANIENGRKGGRPRKTAPPPPEPVDRADADPEQCVLRAVAVPAGMREELRALTADLPAELVQYAVDEAVAGGSPTWKYLRSILQRYRACGFKTREEVSAADARFRLNRQHARTPAAQAYQQHEYTEADFENIYYDPAENRFGEMNGA